MRRLLVIWLILAAAFTVSGGLGWFAVRNYRAAAPLAAENLRGLALTLAGAMEGIASHEGSTAAITSLLSPEVAYATLISPSGKIIYHTNSDLIGSVVDDRRYLPVLATGRLSESRIRLGTGEVVYEFQTPFHLANRTCVLRLALHTWRADAVRRRARQGLTVIFSLLGLGWILGGVIVLLLRHQAAQRRVLERQRELARLGEVGAVLAHEVRTPLAGIKGYGQLLEERLPPGREHDFADRVVGEAKKLESLVDDILFYTRPGSAAGEDALPAEVCAGVLELLRSQLTEAGVRVRLDIPPDLRVACGAEGLRRVMLNLVTNACQASPPGGMITLAAQRRGPLAELSVADQGEGIAPALRAELFLPFRTGKARGSGLGLAICKKIVDGCGGSIGWEEVAGGGTRFLVRLPLAGA